MNVMSTTGFLVLQSGECFSGQLFGKLGRAGEVVFNTSHSGYEEMATDPSYFSQILVMTAPMQGNYGIDDSACESNSISIEGLICLEIQNSSRERSWLNRLVANQVPVLTQIDTRKLVLTLREKGTSWGAIVAATNEEEAKIIAAPILEKKQKQDKDWVSLVSRSHAESLEGEKSKGPRVAIIDFGCKQNIIRMTRSLSSQVVIYPAATTSDEILKMNPAGIILSNGPGDPAAVNPAVLKNISKLLGIKPILGICMGHQILARTIGAKTFALKFGHHGGNHPVKELRTGKIYVTSQNHGYAVEPESLPKDTLITHTNLNDGSVEGIENAKLKFWSVQFHPESHPGPRDAAFLLNNFLNQLQ